MEADDFRQGICQWPSNSHCSSKTSDLWFDVDFLGGCQKEIHDVPRPSGIENELISAQNSVA